MSNRRRRRVTPTILLILAFLGLTAPVVWGQAAPAPAPAAGAKPAPPPAPIPITDQDLKGLTGPKPEDLAKGDPGGTLTGTVNDVVVRSEERRVGKECRL